MEKKKLTLNVDSQIVKKIKFLAVEEDRTITDLVVEAIQDLFTKYQDPSGSAEDKSEQVKDKKKEKVKKTHKRTVAL